MWRRKLGDERLHVWARPGADAHWPVLGVCLWGALGGCSGTLLTRASMGMPSSAAACTAVRTPHVRGRTRKSRSLAFEGQKLQGPFFCMILVHTTGAGWCARVRTQQSGHGGLSTHPCTAPPPHTHAHPCRCAGWPTICLQ